jgi:hypothetical protein
VAVLLALDPADAGGIEDVVRRLAMSDVLERTLTSARPSERRRFRPAWVAAAAAVVAVTAAVLVADPFAGRDTISSAAAKARVARSLELAGNWHVKWVDTFADSSRPAYEPPPSATEIWHAADGRMLVVQTFGDGLRSTTLYANRERRVYDQRNDTVRVHRFALAADMRDEESLYRPPNATRLYRTAYRLGKVRLAGIEQVAGRPAYRLVFDWLGVGYTLVFDADRRVPISSESRSPVNPRQTLTAHERFTAYERVPAGPALERRFEPPAMRAGTRVLDDPPLLIAAPRTGAEATAVARALDHDTGGSFSGPNGIARARFVIVRAVPGGGTAAIVRSTHGATRNPNCIALVQLGHPGGEAHLGFSECAKTIGESLTGTASASGTRMIVAGTVEPGTHRATLRFTNGTRIQLALTGRAFLATPPIGLFRYPVAVLTDTRRDALAHYALLPAPIGLPPWLTR